MELNQWILLAFIGYVFVFMSGVVGVVLWRAKRAKAKPPMEFKLLRAPGESLRKRTAQFDEDSFWKLGMMAVIPPCVGLFVLQMLVWSAPRTSVWVGLGLPVGATLLALFFSGRYCVRQLLRYRNDSLGYLGERAVGEALEPLKHEGFRVFHDVPATSKGSKFNIDHVVVGPNGVFAIETKTRRKGRARPGFEAHKVGYDGNQLIWPWGEDSFGLEQARSRAEWLTQWLQKMTGLGIETKPVLALPGWYVVPKGIGPVLVLNQKQLASSLSRTRAGSLTPEQVDLIARQLDAVCRDVED
jgi:hypothetical protein